MMASKSDDRRNIVPCLLWVKQGCAKRNPDKVTLDKEKLRNIIEKTQEKLDENEASDGQNEEGKDGAMASAEDSFLADIYKARHMAESVNKKKFAGKEARKRKQDTKENDDDDIVKRYGLDNYDDDEETPSDLLHGIGGLTPFASNEDDPYVTLKEEGDSDDEDFELKPTDNLIAVGRVTEEAACMEVHIYNGDLNNLFIHHDYILPTLPLVLEWMDYDIADGQKGNFVAMGTMEPEIGIWDLDVVDSLEPVAVLAGNDAGKKKKKKMKKKETLDSGHTDAVLDLSWNSHVRNVLASASADKTVCLWDLSQGKVVSALTHHDMQVQCVSWHPAESQSLLTGSFDNHAAVIDCRSPSENVKKWKFEGEVERAIWNHFSPFNFLASTDKGMVYHVDVRNSKPLFALSAHEQAVTGMCLSSQIPGLFLTVSPDKHLKVWDIQQGKPSLVLNRHLRMDLLHCVACNPDHPFVFGVGGDKDFKVWDIRESAAVRRHFLSRMPSKLAQECADDEEDLPEDSAADALANLKMEDKEDLAEEEEMLAGDIGSKKKKGTLGDTQPSQASTSKKKKKKKKKGAHSDGL